MTLEREVSWQFRDGMVSGGDPVPADFADALRETQGRLWPFAQHVVFFNTIGSTNDVAIETGSRHAEEGTVVIADEQTAGRGRYGRTGFRRPAAGSMCRSSRASCGRCEPDRVTSLLTLAAGVALAEAIDTATGLAPDIKWPNDLIVGGRKLAGILAEECRIAATPSSDVGRPGLRHQCRCDVPIRPT